MIILLILHYCFHWGIDWVCPQSSWECKSCHIRRSIPGVCKSEWWFMFCPRRERGWAGILIIILKDIHATRDFRQNGRDSRNAREYVRGDNDPVQRPTRYTIVHCRKVDADTSTVWMEFIVNNVKSNQCHYQIIKLPIQRNNIKHSTILIPHPMHEQTRCVEKSGAGGG
jgi:hypothetical protein